MATPVELKLADKRRFTVSVPPHVGDAIDKHSRAVNSTPTEYAADVLRWWFGQGCPPLSDEEEVVRDAMDQTGLNLQLKHKRKAPDE